MIQSVDQGDLAQQELNNQWVLILKNLKGSKNKLY